MSALPKANHDIVKSVARRLCWKSGEDPATQWPEYEGLAKEAVLEVAEWLDDHTKNISIGARLRSLTRIERQNG